MANSAKNVTTGKPMVTGGVWFAPLGTTLPTDATTARGSDFVCVGYISDDGVTNSNSFSSDTIRAWGGDPVQYTQSEYTDDWKFTMIESTNVNVLKATFGEDNVSVDTEKKLVTVKANSKATEEHAWVIERIRSNGNKVRTVIPDGTLTSREDVTFNDSDPVGYGVTISGKADDSGNTHYDYIQTE